MTPGHNRYYGGRSDVLAATMPEIEPVIGGDQIATALGIDINRLYRLLRKHKGHKNAPPINVIPGLGLTADRTTLLAWWARYLGAST